MVVATTVGSLSRAIPRHQLMSSNTGLAPGRRSSLAMSRHRAVRNLNLDEELAEDYDHDVDFLGMPCRLTTDELSPEDQDALEQALLTVIDTLGEPEVCGISERRMKEALWDTYFDAPAAVNLLLEAKEQEEAQARKRAGTYSIMSGASGRAAS